MMLVILTAVVAVLVAAAAVAVALRVRRDRLAASVAPDDPVVARAGRHGRRLAALTAAAVALVVSAAALEAGPPLARLVGQLWP